MKPIDKMEQEIYRIGEEMVQCSKRCKGVAEPRDGVLPRCLYLERDGRDCDERGVIIVGVNPGWAKGPKGDRERNRYIEIQKLPSGKWYGAMVSYWEKHVKDSNPYYTDMRNVLEQLNCKGPILWTELVKCQNGENVKNCDIPLQTYRACIKEYLQKEVKHAREYLPIIIAVGREAYKFVAILFPDRKVLGIPHPKSRGPFVGMFTGQGDVHKRRLKPKIKEELKEFLDNNEVSCSEIVKRNGTYVLL